MFKTKKNQQFLSFFLFSLIIFIIDQISKELARNFLTPGDEIVLVPDFLSLVIVENKGMSFGWLSQLDSVQRLLFLNLIPLFVAIGIMFYFYKNWELMNILEKIGFMLINGGAFGNLFDRFFYGSVTDFTHFLFFGSSLFINNLADDFISLGIAMIFISHFLIKSKN